MKRISIITPVWVDSKERHEELLRCIESVKNQTFRGSYEYIIVNDGSIIPVEIPKYPFIKVVNQANLNRVTAYNTGLKEAKGEIICLLDSDDEYDPKYLCSVDKWFKEYPEYKMFNFGCKYIHKDGGVSEREAFAPKEEKIGHEDFGGGQIVNGTFVFHRSVYDELGAYPPHDVKDIDCSAINYSKGPRELHMTSPYDFSAYAQMEFPALREFFFIDKVSEPNKIIKELGNPWGNDFFIFYKYTRKFHSKPMRENFLYLVHP